MELFNPYYLQIGTFILINAILGISVFITLASGQFSLGAAGFMSVGAYTSALLTMRLGVPMPIAIFAGGVAAALVGAVIGLPTTRLKGLYLAIATLGFGEVVRVVFLNMEITNGALGLNGIPSLSISLASVLNKLGIIDALGLDFQVAGQVASVLVLLLLVVLITHFWLKLDNSRVGRAFAAIKGDEHAAELTGIDVVKYKMVAFVFSSFLAGIGGALYAHATFFINPGDFAYSRVIDILLFTVFGGSNVIWGPILGATVLTLLPEILRFMADYRDTVYGIMLVVLMAFRPDGILTTELLRKIKTIFNKKPEKLVKVAEVE
ncbi:branched-chain amino acid ABC transporter permease [Jeotgalibaca sp. A127]|uniref:branched-chain amino acid ABC transporter permease n=1 Tax=Jeotgalibaca sp. A127 TaxID=3457324 RepID=UPI003FD2EBD7